MNDNETLLIEIYCEGAPDSTHERRHIARMVRTVRTDDTTGWAVARDAGRHNDADQSSVGYDRTNLKCPTCGLNPQVVFDETRESKAHAKMVRVLDVVAAEFGDKLPLHALAGIVSR